MNIYILLIALLITLCSCNDNNNSFELLKGCWKLETVIDSTGTETDFYFINKPGIEYLSTSKFSYLPGPIDLSREEQPELSELIDTIINFRMVDNQISYQSIKNDKTIAKEIKLLKPDSLYLQDSSKKLFKYVRIFKDTSNSNQIDKIVLSTSGCYGVCPIMDIEINKNKSASYYCTDFCGNKGFHKGEIAQYKINKLFELLSYIDIDTLQNSYEANHTDDETITLSFYNKNNLIKTISDYGRMAPTEFIWIYTYLRYIPGLKNLEPNSELSNLLENPRYYLFSQEDKEHIFARSESYNLYTQLLDAKLTTTKIELPYTIYNMRYPVKLSSSYIEYSGKPKVIGYTNGRYFKLNNMNNEIKDLGYNCIGKQNEEIKQVTIDKK